MRFRSNLDETKDSGDGRTFPLFAGCCRDRKADERGWCVTCGHQIADPDPTDSGIELLMRMDRRRAAAIKPRWTPAATQARQLGLALEEPDRAEEWPEEYHQPMPAGEREALDAIDRRQAWRR